MKSLVEKTVVVKYACTASSPNTKVLAAMQKRCKHYVAGFCECCVHYDYGLCDSKEAQKEAD